MKERFAVVDIETTGNSVKNGDRIIQIAIVLMEGKDIVETYDTFINPLKTIPSFIEQLTGISDEMVEDAPVFEEVAPIILDKLKGCYFVAHNIHFDLSFLREELKRVQLPIFDGPVIDTVEMARILFPTIKSYKLQDLAMSLQIEHKNPHRADSDAHVTALIWKKLQEKLAFVPARTLRQLHAISHDFVSDVEPLIHNEIKRKEKVANEVTAPFLQTHSFSIRKHTPVKIEKEQKTMGEMESFDAFLEAETNNWTYPFKLVSNKILEAFETNQHGLIEVEENHSNDLQAFLFPAIYHVNSRQQSVTIACSSSERIYQFFEAWEKNFKQRYSNVTASILKGRKKYLSIQRFERFLQEDETNYDTALTKAQILIWLLETESGDVDELNLSSGGIRIWERLCEGVNNPSHPTNNFSFYQRAIEKAKHASIIFTTHAMLLADDTFGKKHLSQNAFVLVDQAHYFEANGRKFFGQRIEYSHIAQKIQRAEKKFGKLSETVKQKLILLHEQLNELFRYIHFYVKGKNNSDQLNLFRYRYHQDREKGPIWNEIIELVRKNQFLLLDIIQFMNKESSREVKLIHNQMDEDEIISFVDFCQELRLQLNYFFFDTSSEEVFWIEIEAKGAKNAVALYSEPVRIATFLADKFFSKKKSVVLISHALTVKDSFHHWIERLGLTDFYPMTTSLISPLTDESTMNVYVADNLTFSRLTSKEDYSRQLAIELTYLLKRIKGKVIVLFSSVELLKLTYEQMKEIIDREELFIFGQGISGGNPAKVLKTMQQLEEGCLFCTVKFWNRIESHKTFFQTLVVTKLPFSSLQDPIVSANVEWLEQEGKSSFYDYSLPESVIALKDAVFNFRHSTETQALFLLDHRIQTSHYGSYFKNSLKVGKWKYGNFINLIQDAIQQER